MRGLKSFRRNESGNAAMLFSFLLLPTMVAAGTAVDYTRAAAVRSEMQTAVDSAAIAVARDGNGLSAADLIPLGRRYFDANFQPRSDITVTDFTVSRVNKVISVTAKGNVKTTTMGVMAVDKIDLTANSQTTFGVNKIELALVLDNTGSMSNSSKMTNLKTAANNLLDILENSAPEPDSFKISIVPFTTQVKVGAASKSATWLSYTVPGIDASIVTDKSHWGGCVIDRNQNNDVDASAPVPGNSATLYPAVDCAQSSLAKLMPLSTDYSALHTKVDNMVAAGNTNVTIGVAWGLNMLTPDAPLSVAQPFDTPSLTKIMIVLTDGDNTQNRFTTNQTQIDARTELACTNVKNEHIRVYTIRVIDGNADLLRNCATSSSFYYDVTNASQLNPVFEAIGNEIAAIRLTQ